MHELVVAKVLKNFQAEIQTLQRTELSRATNLERKSVRLSGIETSTFSKDKLFVRKVFKWQLEKFRLFRQYLFPAFFKCSITALPERTWVNPIYIHGNSLNSAICSCFRGRGIDYLAKERDNDSVLQASEEQCSLTPGAFPVCGAVMSAHTASGEPSSHSLCPVLHSALRLYLPPQLCRLLNYPSAQTSSGLGLLCS